MSEAKPPTDPFFANLPTAGAGPNLEDMAMSLGRRLNELLAEGRRAEAVEKMARTLFCNNCRMRGIESDPAKNADAIDLAFRVAEQFEILARQRREMTPAEPEPAPAESISP